MPAREWVAVYYDNPEEVPAEKLRCATRSPWMRIMSFPPTAKVITAAIAGGDYACARARWWITTSPPRGCSFRQPAAEHGVSHRPQPCFEVYLNDGNHDGYWDIDMYVPVERVAS